MWILLLIALVGVNFACMLIPSLDGWHAQGIVAQGMIMIAFSSSFFMLGRLRNVPLGLISLWTGLSTLFICYLWQVQGKYNVTTFFPYFNFLCLLVMYQLIVQFLNNKQVEKILVYLKYVSLVTLFVCTLQYFHLAQFFKLLRPNDIEINNPVIGFIGNGTHLSGILACSIPLFLYKFKRQDLLSIVLTFIVMLFAGTKQNDPSISGPIIALFILAYHSIRYGWWKWYLGVCCALGLFILPYIGKGFFEPKTRILIWQQYYNIWKQMPVTGVGLGAVNKIYQHTSVPNARHLHNEYFQYLFELGIIGLTLILNMVVAFVRKPVKSDLDWTLKACIFGFLISSLFNFPSHLWMPSMWAMFYYAALHVKDEQWDYQESKLGI